MALGGARVDGGEEVEPLVGNLPEETEPKKKKKKKKEREKRSGKKEKRKKKGRERC